MTIPQRTVAIIGIGPRGSYALERYIIELAKSNILQNLHLLLFDAQGKFGYGPVYELTQNDANWLNISERILLLDKRPAIQYENITIPSFPSYHEWLDKDFASSELSDLDNYPLRSKLGSYLHQRFQSLAVPLQKEKIISTIISTVVKVDKMNTCLFIECADSSRYDNVDEVLITIGHQPTEESSQLKEWNELMSNDQGIRLYSSPYPLSNYLDSALDGNSSIGVRGFGLAMIDIVRGIANKFGEFAITNRQTRKFSYSSVHKCKNLIIPFSLDGLPPVPKPLNAEIDNWFKPNEKQIKRFEEIIGDKEIHKSARTFDFLIEAFAPIAARIFSGLSSVYAFQTNSKEEITDIIKAWLNDDQYMHPTILNVNQSAYKLMQEFAGMASGMRDISLDYCIGQVWRHCQPSIYDKLSYNDCQNDIVVEIVNLDERVKRYSFGPPVDSIQQLIALVDAEVLSLEWVKNPGIDLSIKGWNLNNGSKTILVKSMINSVLDAPVLKAVNSPVIRHLLANDMIKAVHDDLGIATDACGYILSEGSSDLPIAVLGRLAKGTIIGVDAILECFGQRPLAWAEAAAKHHNEFLNKYEFQ